MGFPFIESSDITQTKERLAIFMGEQMEAWQQSWKDLWNFIESLSCSSIINWANANNCPVVCIPAHKEWPNGLLVIQWPNGSKYAYPITAMGHASKLRSMPVSQAQWMNWVALWKKQQDAWAQVTENAQEFTARLVPPYSANASSM